MVFEPRDWVWVHIRKEIFLAQRRSKLILRWDGPFQIIENINNNTYKIELPVKYGVGTIFNVFDLSLFDISDDSRVNLFKKKENDVILALTPRDPLEVQLGPVTMDFFKKQGLRQTSSRNIHSFKIYGLRWTSRGYQRIKNKHWLVWFMFKKIL